MKENSHRKKRIENITKEGFFFPFTFSLRLKVATFQYSKMESGKEWEEGQIENTNSIGCFGAFSERSIKGTIP